MSVSFKIKTYEKREFECSIFTVLKQQNCTIVYKTSVMTVLINSTYFLQAAAILNISPGKR